MLLSPNFPFGLLRGTPPGMHAARWSGTVLVLGFVGCGGYAVPYEGAQGAARKAGEVAIYDIECKDPAMGPADCTYNGGPMGFKAIGVFRVPPKALKDWASYRKKVQEQAARYGCPAVALRRMGPAMADAQTTGGFCIDPAATPGGPASAGGPNPGPGISVTGTVNVTACQQASDCPAGTACNRGQCVAPGSP